MLLDLLAGWLPRLSRVRSVPPVHRRADRAVPNDDDALPALTVAWVLTVIAMALLYAALAIAPVWDSSAYLRELATALSLDP
jgi:hypothetical protein